jgi:2-haloalkanoic acid dehalogenase type II
MVKFTHLTFDCYGTLIDWRNGLESHLGGLLQTKGLPRGVSVYPIYVKLEAEQEARYRSYRSILHDTAISVAQHFHLLITDNEAREFAETIPNWKPFSDTVEGLKLLGKLGFRRVVLSNIDRDLLEKTIAQNNLAIDGYITAEDVGSYKPSPGHWNRFFQEYKVTMEETLHVAQSIYHDIIPSSRMGIATAWINRYSNARPVEVSPTFIFPDLAGLLTLLDQLRSR